MEGKLEERGGKCSERRREKEERKEGRRYKGEERKGGWLRKDG